MFDLKTTLDSLREAPYVSTDKPKEHNYPSSASVSHSKHGYETVEGECLRKEWYRWKKYPVPPGSRSARISRILDAGDMYEAMIINEIKNAGLYIADQVPIYIPEYNISGRIDVFIKDPTLAPPFPQRPSPEHLIGIDIKTTGGYQKCKGKIFSTRDTPLAPETSHVLQCLCYLHYYMPYGIKKWQLLYLDRALGASESNPTHMSIHTITINENGNPVISNESGTEIWDHFTVQDMFDRFKHLNNMVKANSLPERDYHIQYSNSRIISMYDADVFNKTQKETVTKGIKNCGVPKQDITDDMDPIAQIGDWQCRYCEFMELCYSDNPAKTQPKPIIKNVKAPKISDEPLNVEDLA
jgi:hypothetical protein